MDLQKELNLLLHKVGKIAPTMVLLRWGLEPKGRFVKRVR